LFVQLRLILNLRFDVGELDILPCIALIVASSEKMMNSFFRV